jgi:hypothetical protein
MSTSPASLSAQASCSSRRKTRSARIARRTDPARRAAIAIVAEQSPAPGATDAPYVANGVAGCSVDT